MATTLLGGMPLGRERATIPYGVNVRTAEPGSSASTPA